MRRAPHGRVLPTERRRTAVSRCWPATAETTPSPDDGRRPDVTDRPQSGLQGGLQRSGPAGRSSGWTRSPLFGSLLHPRASSARSPPTRAESPTGAGPQSNCSGNPTRWDFEPVLYPDQARWQDPNPATTFASLPPAALPAPNPVRTGVDPVASDADGPGEHDPAAGVTSRAASCSSPVGHRGPASRIEWADRSAV